LLQFVSVKISGFHSSGVMAVLTLTVLHVLNLAGENVC